MSEDPPKHHYKHSKEEEDLSKLIVSDTEVYYWNSRMDRVNLMRRRSLTMLLKPSAKK